MYAIPGQHDLPNHSYDQMHRSTYGTLVAAGKIINLPPGEPFRFRKGHGNDYYVTGFPWGSEITPGFLGDDWHYALVHKYIWTKGTGFPGAPEESRLRNIRDQFKHYKAVIIGDNHQAWDYEVESFFFNCGTFMRRKLDERHYRPRVGLLHQSGVVSSKYLDCQEDKFIDTGDIERALEVAFDGADFLGELSKLGKKLVDFREAVEQFCVKNGISDNVKKIISEVIDNGS
jgi:hypothetical protein